MASHKHRYRHSREVPEQRWQSLPTQSSDRQSKKARGGRAKALTKRQMDQCIEWVRANSTSPEGDELKLLLSFKAGLRAGEIAQLPIDSMLDPYGNPGHAIYISAKRSKSKTSREIPMHTEIKRALKNVLKLKENIEYVAYTKAGDHIEYQSANAVAQWFRRLYIKLGLQGCSSHSGRRSFITKLARTANLHGNSLRDVQVLAGHARLDTTETYIDQSINISKLINSL